MRCEEAARRLVDLLYDELDVAEAAECRAHLQDCASCQAEWAALRDTHALLDSVREEKSKVDVAQVCLRLVRDQRQRHARWRWAAGVAAVAAAVLVFVGSRWLQVNLEPGRVVVAWRAADDRPLDARPGVPGPAVPHSTPVPEPSGSSAQLAASGQDLPRQMRAGEAEMLALLIESDGLRNWAPRRELWQLHEGREFADGALSQRSETSSGVKSDNDSATDAQSPSKTYTELRRQMMGEDSRDAQGTRLRGG